jgi:hypothetical protein
MTGRLVGGLNPDDEFGITLSDVIAVGGIRN